MKDRLPEIIADENNLTEVMTRPGEALVASIRRLESPLILLGAGGKMGPTLAVLALRAAKAARYPLEVIAVSRFSDQGQRQWLEHNGVSTLSCDLFDVEGLGHLPDTRNLVYLVGMKFGTSDSPARTWAFNTLVPGNICERYPQAKIVALSSGNVYPLVPVESGGAVESNALTPLGEYANSCVARERIFEYYAQQMGTKMSLIRLNYALDLRYGVLVDLARKIYNEQAIDVTMGYFNAIWQGDANDLILRCFDLAESPPVAFNLTSLEVHSVRATALRLGELMGKQVRITGQEANTALLSNPSSLFARLGAPATPFDTVLRWTAKWFELGGELLDKPTHFETRDGKY